MIGRRFASHSANEQVFQPRLPGAQALLPCIRCIGRFGYNSVKKKLNGRDGILHLSCNSPPSDCELTNGPSVSTRSDSTCGALGVLLPAETQPDPNQFELTFLREMDHVQMEDLEKTRGFDGACSNVCGRSCRSAQHEHAGGRHDQRHTDKPDQSL